jgi:hypothetical protein
MKTVLFFFLNLTLLFGAGIFSVSNLLANEKENVIELTGRIAKRPDILVLEMLPNAPAKEYQESFAKIAKKGSSLPSAAFSIDNFRKSGLVQMLKHADYEVVFVNERHWAKACENIDDILKYQKVCRGFEGNEVRPYCFVVSAEASPEEFYSHFAPLLESNALIFLMTPSSMVASFPLTIFWHRYVWPNHLVEMPVRLDQWIPTLAEVVEVLPPANIIDPSILPSLTGVGYQRPSDVRPKQTKTNFVTFRSYPIDAEKMKYTHWVPSVENMISDSRQYIEGSLPLSKEIVDALTVDATDRVILVRSNVDYFYLTLPASISVVIKKDGMPICSTWKTPCQRLETFKEPMGIEFLFYVPAGVDPAPLKEFLTNPKHFEKTSAPLK